MADYAKSTLTTRYSDSSDYSDGATSQGLIAQTWTKEQTTPTERLLFEGQILQASSTTLDLGKFTTVQSVAIYNEDASEYLTVTMASVGNSNATYIQRIPAGEFIRVCDVTISTDIVLAAQTTDCDNVRVIVYGT